MSNLFNDLMKYGKWTGNREEFLAVITHLEQSHVDDCMLKSSKKPYDLLPVNARRIQWFTSNKIIPVATKRVYEHEHLVYYMHAILLRKKGKLTFNQIVKHISNFTFDDALKNIEEGVDQKKISAMFTSSNFMENDDAVCDGLKRLGREEGRPLKSTLTRFAITPWCHVTINERKIRNLTKGDADILAGAFLKSLRDLID